MHKFHEDFLNNNLFKDVDSVAFKSCTVTLRKAQILPVVVTVTDCENNPTSSGAKKRNIAEKLLPRRNPITLSFLFPSRVNVSDEYTHKAEYVQIKQHLLFYFLGFI